MSTAMLHLLQEGRGIVWEQDKSDSSKHRGQEMGVKDWELETACAYSNWWNCWFVQNAIFFKLGQTWIADISEKIFL